MIFNDNYFNLLTTVVVCFVTIVTVLVNVLISWCEIVQFSFSDFFTNIASALHVHAIY